MCTDAISALLSKLPKNNKERRLNFEILYSDHYVGKSFLNVCDVFVLLIFYANCLFRQTQRSAAFVYLILSREDMCRKVLNEINGLDRHGFQFWNFYCIAKKKSP